MLSPVFSESNDSFPSTASAALRAARLLWAQPRARGRSRTPLYSARRLRRSLPATDRSGSGPEPALGDGFPWVADGDAPRRRATPRSRRRHAKIGFRAVHARPAGGMDGRRPPGVSRPFGSRCRNWTRSSYGRTGARPRRISEARREHFGQRGLAKFARRPSRHAAPKARSAHEPRARIRRGATGASRRRDLGAGQIPVENRGPQRRTVFERLARTGGASLGGEPLAEFHKLCSSPINFVPFHPTNCESAARYPCGQRGSILPTRQLCARKR